MSTIRRSRVSYLWIAIAIAVPGSAVIAGCGGAGAAGGTGTNEASGIQFAQCMRANGVPNFPDAHPGGYQIRPGSSLNLQSPAAQSALNACEKNLPQSGQSPPVPASVRQQERALARCMRANGVPNFPDPDANGNIQFPIDSAIPKSPAFQRAQNGACKKYLNNG